MVPATSLTSTRSSRRILFTSDDLPTFGRPMMAMPGSRGVVSCFGFPIALIYTLKHGLIAHERRVYDFTGMLVQIGLLKAKPA